MARRSRIRRILKWAGLAICVLILVAWGISIRWLITYGYHVGRVQLGRGLVSVSQDNSYVRRGFPGFPGWTFHRLSSGTGNQRSLLYLFGMQLPRTHVLISTGGNPAVDVTRPIQLPLWLPFLLAAVPTWFLFYRDRRRRIPPGHCQRCGYNLTGNTSGICPECGEQIAAQEVRSPDGADRSDSDDTLETIP